LLDEFGHPILQFRSGPFSVDNLVHAEQFPGLDGEGSITAPATVRDSLSRPCETVLEDVDALAVRRRHAQVKGIDIWTAVLA
jgi:hypothetical protein